MSYIYFSSNFSCYQHGYELLIDTFLLVTSYYICMNISQQQSFHLNYFTYKYV